MKYIFKKIVVWIISLEARLVLLRYRPRIIGITGNVGKTSTKDAVALVYGQFFNIKKTQKSLNSEIGVPLTILGHSSAWGSMSGWIRIICSGLWLVVKKHPYPRWLILEVGADHPGDIRSIARWIKPDIFIGTRLSDVPVHVEFFNGPEEVMREKRYLAEAVKKDGVLILNYDDSRILSFKEGIERKTITYGMDERADIRGTNISIAYTSRGIPQGVTFKVGDGRSTVPVTINGTIGDHVIYTTLAALAAGSAEGLNLIEMSQCFDAYVPPPGRMRIIKGLKGSIVIDDSYNSSPVALENALHALHTIDTNGRKIAVIGDMRELGEYSHKAHEEAGKKVSLVADILFAVGDNRDIIADAALKGGMDERQVYTFQYSKDAGKELELILTHNDVVLVKGSQYVRLEKVVEEIMAEPQKADELLVRQEEEWKAR